MTTKVGSGMLQPGATSLPTTTKGDLVVHDGTSNVRKPVGADGTVLTADSASGDGLAWKTPGSIPVGLMAPFGASTPPSGWLVCDGSAVSRTTYADLFAVIGTTWGAGDGSTTFNLPPLSGMAVIGAGSGSRTFTLGTVDTGADTVVVPDSSMLQTGQVVTYSTTGSAIGGLTDGTKYGIIRVDSTHIQFVTGADDAERTRNAVDGKNIVDLTGAGSGTHTIRLDLTTRTLGETHGVEQHALTTSEIPSHQHTAATPDFGGGTGSNNAANSAKTGATGGSNAHTNMQPSVVALWIIYAGV